MKRTLRIAALMAMAIATSAAQSGTAKVVVAANKFLGTLDEKQRKLVLFAYDDEQQRKRWSNFPVTMVPRAGLSLKAMSVDQRNTAMSLLSTVLSKRGFEKVLQIMDGDEQLKTGSGGGGGRGGGDLMFGKDLFFFSILGTPSEKMPWMLQFGGHHLAINITILGERGILTPTLTAAQPALYTLNGKTVRPLGAESDKALALLSALDESQRKQAILGYRVVDLVLGPGQDGKTIQPEGLKASAMNEKQRAMLLDVVSEWAGIVHEAEAKVRMAELKADINETWFAWSGATAADPGRNINAYYRIQGPRLVIEYAPQALGGDPTLHVHTIYRDPTNDYGRKSNVK